MGGKACYTDSTALDRVSWARREPDVIALSAAELAALEGLELAAGSRLEKARAWFLLACYTGLRYSDLVSIRPQHLRPATVTLPTHLRLTAQKTRTVVNVPLSARASHRQAAAGRRVGHAQKPAHHEPCT